MSRPRHTVRLLAAAAPLMLAAACGTSTVSPGASTGATKPAPGSVLGVASTSLGSVLVDSQGRTVYLLTADKPGQSTCSAQCLAFWPPVSAPAGSKVPPVNGVSAPLAATKATNGASMVTAGGWPLYTFAKDKAPGDVNGQGKKSFGGTWYVVSPAGKAVTAAAKSAPSTSSGGAGGGYGY
jgi:predicted lipoprotein with Yx(FWY)xxD motif